MKTNLIRLLTPILVWISLNPDMNCQNIGLVDIRKAELVITVGGTGADIPGYTSQAIQLALDAV